ncbi:hypothetical protein [Flavobacterium sp.]|uniref:hypothetical protein n=1 Tax=Flavobacterium sp. TaxID=239 RepID=UPI003750DD00
MKKFTVFFLFFTIISFAQKKEAVYKKLATTTCECAKAKGEEKISDVSLGICIFQSLDKLDLKEQKIIGYNPEKKMETVEKVAENVGLEMALICPEIFANMQSEDEAVVEEVVEDTVDLLFTGNYDSMISNEFNTIRIIDENKVSKDFVWLFPYDGDTLFIKKKVDKGEKIEVRYREQEFFEAKSNSYKTFYEILEIKLL